MEGIECRRGTELYDFMAVVREVLSREGFVAGRLDVHILVTMTSEALRRPTRAKRVSNISILVKTESHAQRITIDSFSAPCQHQFQYGPLQGGC